MVGLADIPCVGKFVERVSDKAVDAVFRGFRYVFRYKALVDKLTSETEKLNIEMDTMSAKIEEEKANGKKIKDHVEKWQNDVEEIQKSDKEFSPSCKCIQLLPIPNPVSRFRIGRNAAKKAISVAQLTNTGKDYLTEGIAGLPPFKNMPKPDTKFEEFESRKDVYKKLWDALVNKDSPLVHGIYGMAGVGKTRMMEKFWEDAMEKDIFKKVVRVNVGNENLDKMKLQDLIAGRLNCKLESQDVESRAAQLENSFKNGGKILLILDDLWDEIPLDNIIGTPFGDGSSSSGSKILVTSRQKDACLKNKCEHLVEIKTLNSDEALYLFKNTVGSGTIDSLQDKSWVQKICDECGHLPLLIHAVGKALERKGDDSWMDAHDQLKNGKFDKIPGVPPKVCAGIRLSIDYLQQDDAKSCLFLCSLFPEDAEIDMQMLIQLATGSQLIPDGKSRVLSMVGSLKESSLLLDSGKDNETKVHDIIRDVARSIAFTDSKYSFLQVTCNSGYLPSNANYCTRKFLRLDAETADVYFNENLECPDLHTLWLQSNYYYPQKFLGGFFTMFANLRFLMLQNVNISLEKFSLQPLVELRTLNLLECDIRKTDVSLFPESLETLCICDCELPVPMNVGNLNYLRKLEIQVEQWQPKLVMGSNVISSLSRLEELHIPNGYIIDHGEYVIDPIVTEISKLTHLTSLQFHFYNDDTFEGRNVFYKLKRYNILFDRMSDYDWERFNFGRVIWLYGNNLQSWECLMARAEEVRLVNSDIEVSSICNGHGRAFEDLKELYIDRCNNMGHLARISQDDSLQHGATCFSKLTILEIKRCSELKYLFCNNIAKNLLQLQQLTVRYCQNMEAIILNEGTSHEKIINFPKLKSLWIGWLPRLASFYAEKKKNMHAGSRVPMGNSAQHQPLFDGMVTFPSLEELIIRGCENMGNIQPAACFSKLTSVQINNCSKLKYLFCNNIARDFSQLQKLNVSNCESMEAIIANEGTTDGKIINFPKLKHLEIENMSRLASFYAPSASTLSMDPAARCIFDGMVAFPSLEELIIHECENMGNIQPATCFSKLTSFEINKCPKLKYLFCNNIAKNLPQLQSLRVNNCESMEAIITNEGTTDGKIINFPKLKHLKIQNMSRLASFYAPSASTLSMDPSAICSIFDGMVAFPSLEELYIDDSMPYASVIWGKDCFNNDTVSSFSKLEHLTVSRCDKLEIVIPHAMLPRLSNLKLIQVYHCSNLRTMFPPSVASDLRHLTELSVGDCREMREIIEEGEQVITDGILFPELTYIYLRNMPCLTSVWCYQSGKASTCKVPLQLPQLSSISLYYLPQLRRLFHGANFEFHVPALKEVRVDTCEFSTLFTFSMFRKFQLEHLEVRNCQLLENIVEDVRADETCDNIIRLSQLTAVKFENLPNLKSFFHTAVYEFHMPVIKEKVIVRNCGLFNDPSFQALSSGISNNSGVSYSTDNIQHLAFQKKSLRKLRLKLRLHLAFQKKSLRKQRLKLKLKLRLQSRGH